MAATRWQTHLLMIALAVVMSGFNAFAAGHLTIAEGVWQRAFRRVLNNSRLLTLFLDFCSLPRFRPGSDSCFPLGSGITKRIGGQRLSVLY